MLSSLPDPRPSQHAISSDPCDSSVFGIHNAHTFLAALAIEPIFTEKRSPQPRPRESQLLAHPEQIHTSFERAYTSGRS